jgi:hypothetical protein
MCEIIMICKECQKQQLKSRVYGGDSGMITLLGYSFYYDEEGNPHSHDPNTTTYYLKCSNGHAWIERSYYKCWCGWTNEKP